MQTQLGKITHIIYISYEPYISKYGEDFYFDIAENEGYKVEYWNLYFIYHKKKTIGEALANGIEKKFSSYNNLINEVKNYRNFSLFIFKINYSGKVFKLFRIFSIYKCTTAFFARGALPFFLQSQSLKQKFITKFKAFKKYSFIKNAIQNQLAAEARKRNIITPFTYVLYAGSESLPVIGYGYNYGLNRSTLIPVNSFDYDKYLTIKSIANKIVEEPYCVFLDTYLPYHPDFDLLKMPKVNAQTYYTAINKFFDYVEDIFKIKIVIAAHPKSNYEQSGAYKHRLLVKNRTAELIKDASFVITHASTSISFAVLFQKPIIFVYNNEMKKIYEHGQYALILNFAHILKATCLNIDDDINRELKILPVNTSAYNNYKYKYLTNTESEENLSQNIFKTFLKEQLAFSA